MWSALKMIKLEQPKQIFLTTCWLHDVRLYFFPDVCLTNWTFWVLSTTVATNCQISAWQKHDRSFRLKTLFAQIHLLELFEFLSSTFILRCAGWPTSFFRCRQTISVLWLSDWRWRWAFHLLESKNTFHQVCKTCESCVVIFNLFKKSSSNFFITETHHFCFSYKWRRLHFFVYSLFQFSSLFSWIKNWWEFVRRRQKPGPEAVWGMFATEGPAGFMATGRSKFGNLLKTLTTNLGPFFWRRYSHVGNHLACSNHGLSNLAQFCCPPLLYQHLTRSLSPR